MDQLENLVNRYFNNEIFIAVFIVSRIWWSHQIVIELRIDLYAKNILSGLFE